MTKKKKKKINLTALFEKDAGKGLEWINEDGHVSKSKANSDSIRGYVEG